MSPTQMVGAGVSHKHRAKIIDMMSRALIGHSMSLSQDRLMLDLAHTMADMGGVLFNDGAVITSPEGKVQSVAYVGMVMGRASAETWSPLGGVCAALAMLTYPVADGVLYSWGPVPDDDCIKQIIAGHIRRVVLPLRDRPTCTRLEECSRRLAAAGIELTLIP